MEIKVSYRYQFLAILSNVNNLFCGKLKNISILIYCSEGVILVVTSFFFSEEKTSESLTGIENMTLRDL